MYSVCLKSHNESVSRRQSRNSSSLYFSQIWMYFYFCSGLTSTFFWKAEVPSLSDTHWSRFSASASPLLFFYTNSVRAASLPQTILRPIITWCVGLTMKCPQTRLVLLKQLKITVDRLKRTALFQIPPNLALSIFPITNSGRIPVSSVNPKKHVRQLSSQFMPVQSLRA